MTATDDTRLPADAFTPPDAEAIATGHSRFTAGLDALCQPDYDAPNPERHPNCNPARIAGGRADGRPVPEPALFASVEHVRGLLVARDRTGQVVTPLAARKPDEDTYSRTSSGRVLAEVDEALYDAAWRDNARLRQERDAALDERDDAQRRMGDALRLNRVGAEIRAQLESERDAARKRVAELELTVKALGEVIAHAAGHDKGGSGVEGGE